MDEARVLHVMLRVGDMARSVDFYTGVLGMQVVRTLDQPDEGYSLAFLGYTGEREGCVLELTCNYGVSGYDKGNAYGHVAIGVPDCRQACAHIQDHGGRITYGPSRLKGSQEIIAFCEDPDGYRIELVQWLSD